MSVPETVESFYGERLEEIHTHLAFLGEIERVSQDGPPRLQPSGTLITTAEQKILYSTVYLQLYNLVEATISRSLAAVVEAAAATGQWKPVDLSEALRGEWIRSTAQTHVDLNAAHRLERAIAMVDVVAQSLPLGPFKIEKGGGGNWDDETIFEMSKRIGCKLAISRAVNKSAKEEIRDGMGPMKLVCNRRNKLAHGEISFVDCADGVTVSELRRTVEAVGRYLEAVARAFDRYIAELQFLHTPPVEPASPS